MEWPLKHHRSNASIIAILALLLLFAIAQRMDQVMYEYEEADTSLETVPVR